MKKLNHYQKQKIKKVSIIAAIVLAIIAVILTTYFIIVNIKNQNKIESYEDNVVSKNLFKQIKIDLNSRKVMRDATETTLQEEFGIPNQQAELIYGSKDELQNYFANSTFEVNINGNEVTLTNPYQTKTLLVEAEQIKDNFDAIEEKQVQEGLYILKYDTQKRARAAYEYIKTNMNVKNIEADEVQIITPINDESQTLYENSNKDTESGNSYGVSAMGISNYKKIITDNGSAEPVVISTIGYGAAIDNTYFEGKISEEYFNFFDNSKDIKETIPQGSRTLEVIKESTTDNVKILPLVVVNNENYTTTACIVQAIAFATQKSDVICYELVHKSNYMIKLTLQNAFKENIPVCCVTKAAIEEEEMFPADDATTIAVSSVDKELKTTSYSANGEYLDFVASSTDVKEIFNGSSSVSKWSGAEYSNAHIASLIALIKTYNKDSTILEVYNFIRNFCQDLGENGKDKTYGYGFPNFTNIKISDIDKVHPDLADITVDNTKWEKTKKVQVKANDNIKIFGWAITDKNEAPKEWKQLENVQKTLDVSEELKDNGIFYVWIVDTAGNAINKTCEVTKIDKISPTIKYTIDESRIEREKLVTINASATDDQSGLHELAYSWDKQNWGQSNTILTVRENGTYTLYVRDKLENISERKITINSLPEKGTAEIDDGLIIKSIEVSDKWEGNVNKEVTIIFNDNLEVKRRKITESDIMPEEFRPSQDDTNSTSSNYRNSNVVTDDTVITTIENGEIQGRTNVTFTVSLEEGKKYYVWVEDSTGNVISQGFKIKK